jgi:PAS domain S-box-containing protein
LTGATGEARIRELFDALPQPIGVHHAGRLVYANRALAELLGYSSPQELLGATADQVLIAEDIERAEQRTAAMLDTGSPAPPTQLRFRRRDGSEVIADVASAPVDWEGQRAILVVLHDVSGTRSLHARVLQTDRMAAIGTLAAGLAHEVNNPLAYVLSNMNHVLDQLPQLASALRGPTPPPGASAAARLDELVQSLAEALEGAERVRAIVRDVRIFSRADEAPAAPLDVRRVLDSAIGMARNEIRHRARLVCDYGDLPRVQANESRLGQVFLNLLLNAAQALTEGDSTRNEVHVRAFSDDAGSVVVEIADTGCGIAPEALPRVFDPFFTTKPMGVGTGLGLAICHSIVTGLGGSISLESAVGQGTTARITLPPSEGYESAPRLRAAAPVARSRVLVVDDEPAVGRAIRRELARHHDVTVARGGREALDLLRADASYDVVLCDVMMPDLGGDELWEHVRRERPGLEQRFLFMTGGAFTQRAREFLASVRNRCLDKPFAPGELLGAIAGVADAGSRRSRP